MKILFCFGTRPEAIKMAGLIDECKKREIEFKVCVTAQHREMLDQVLGFFKIHPDFDLNLMEKNQSLNSLSSRILIALDPILTNEKPDLVIVQGDTTSAAMTAMAAFHKGIKVAHVEAGLRTYNKMSPFPEEMNRQLISRIADYHFAPTSIARDNLLNENMPQHQVFITGNTVIDALFWARKELGHSANNLEIERVNSLLDEKNQLVLLTGHRRENFGRGFENICEAIIQIAKREKTEVMFPVHLNPRLKITVEQKLGGKKNIHLIPPVSYPTMLWLMGKACLIISDSGGIQEEISVFKKPIIVTRESTERMEGVKAGYSFLAGTDTNRIVGLAYRFLNNPPDFSKLENPYGNGKASQLIMDIIQERN